MKRLLIALCLLLVPAGLLAGSGWYFESGYVRGYHMDSSGVIDPNYPGTPTACWDFDSAVGGTYTDDCAATYSMTVNGSPSKVDDATWPSGLSGSQGSAWEIDGAADYLSRADDGTFDPGGDFSVQFVITPELSSASMPFGKWIAGTNQRGWVIYLAANGTISLYLSDNGTGGAGHQSYVSKATACSAYRPAFITATYDYISDGNSVATLYVDNLSTATNSSMDGPVFNSSADFRIGADGAAGNKYKGDVHQFTYYDGIVITEAQHDEMFARWQGRSSTAGDTVRVTVSSASPPAIPMAYPSSGTQPFLVDQPANSGYVGSPASGSGGIYSAGAITNLVQRASFETWAGAGDATGWVETKTNGNGSAAITEENTIVAHGGSSVKMVLTGTTSIAKIHSSFCVIGGAGSSDVYLSIYEKKSGGITATDIIVTEYDAANCTSYLQDTTVLSAQDVTTSWAEYGGLMASGSWHASTSSYKIVIREQCNGGCTTYIDAVQARVASTPTDAFCGCDTDASCVCNLVDITDDNPPTGMTGGSWTFEATVRSPIDGAEATPVRQIMYVPATSGNNNKISLSWASDVLTCSVWDSSGTEKSSTVAAAGNADTDYAVKCSKSSAGVVTACWAGSCDATPATGATTAGIGSEMVLGSDGSTGGDVWVNDPVIYRRVR